MFTVLGEYHCRCEKKTGIVCLLWLQWKLYEINRDKLPPVMSLSCIVGNVGLVLKRKKNVWVLLYHFCSFVYKLSIMTPTVWEEQYKTNKPAFLNLLPTLPTRQLNHHRRQFIRLHTTSSRANLCYSYACTCKHTLMSKIGVVTP